MRQFVQIGSHTFTREQIEKAMEELNQPLIKPGDIVVLKGGPDDPMLVIGIERRAARAISKEYPLVSGLLRGITADGSSYTFRDSSVRKVGSIHDATDK